MTLTKSYYWIKKQVDRVRDIDLEKVLIHSNCQRDDKDKKKWHTPQGRLSVTAQQFMNWSQGTGGGGAIDLVMHLRGCRFADAVSWLAHAFPDAVSSGDIKPEGIQTSPNRTLQFQLPPRHDGCTPQVIKYLSIQRGIPSYLIKALLQEGKLYADSRANAVFLLLGKEKKVVGAELRGTGKTPWKGMAPGSDKKQGCFSIQKGESQKVLLCESAIDAISCFIFNPDCIILSTAGVCSDYPWLQAVINKGFQVFCAFDADQVGDSFADKMTRKHPEILRLRPPCKDWNEALQQRTRQASISFT